MSAPLPEVPAHPHDILPNCQVMAFSLLSACWHYFHSQDYAQEEDLPCEDEEEEDPTCWVLGKFLLFYCLAIALLKILYHGLEWMHENHRGAILASGCLIKNSKGKKDGRQTGPRIGAGCACCCRFGVCGFLRKLFGEQEKAFDSASSSVTLERRLSKRLSKLSQQTFCDSDSSETGSLASFPATQKASRTEETLSVSSLEEMKVSQVVEAPRGYRTKDQPCLRCKAKRTKEWLAQHFFVEEQPSGES